MESSITASELDGPLDVLAYLPVSATNEYRKGQTIYGPDHPSSGIYLVVMGKVEISHVAEECSEMPLGILGPDELFGESVFLDLPTERATVLESAKLMSWTVSQIEDLMMKQPRLGIALLQVMAQRNAELIRRIESFSIDNIERRLARLLIHFSERLGTPEENGSVRMMPLTHELLSRHLGTSRELVTHFMIRFRKQGYMSYSRQGILVNCEALKAAICENHVPTAEKSNKAH